jgi:DNA modification methylase
VRLGYGGDAMATRTRTFGAGNRESHDASDFYARFTPPKVSKDATVNPCTAADRLIVGDARDMSEVPDNSVALVITSPPYFAGKAYETELDADGIPANYLEYLEMLRDVFAECVRVLEPGGRIAVNVANLGRKPYRSLAGDVTTILQDELALLLRGEIVWVKAKGAAGSCAFGSYMKASNPVLRDLSERVVVASKGRFDRAIPWQQRAELGMPHESTISKEEFLASTLDVWEIRPERARRVQHPAPFPVELPERFIRLYTYAGDVVLDPFLGSGSTAVAAAQNGRRYVGYDTDPAYVDIARARVADEGGLTA